MQRRYITADMSPVRVESREDGTSAIVGYGAVFYRKQDVGTQFKLWAGMVERIAPGAFDRALQEGDDVRALFNHDPDNLLGRTAAETLKLSVDKVGLRYEIPLSDADPDHQRVASKIERGDLTGSSFAFTVEAERWTEDKDREVRWIDGVRLFDVGPVTYPAYDATSTGLRSECGIEEARTAWIRWKEDRVHGENLQRLNQSRMRIAELT